MLFFYCTCLFQLSLRVLISSFSDKRRAAVLDRWLRFHLWNRGYISGAWRPHIILNCRPNICIDLLMFCPELTSSYDWVLPFGDSLSFFLLFHPHKKFYLISGINLVELTGNLRSNMWLEQLLCGIIMDDNLHKITLWTWQC